MALLDAGRVIPIITASLPSNNSSKETEPFPFWCSMNDGARASSATMSSPPKSGMSLASGIIRIAITIKAPIRGSGRIIPFLTKDTRYAMMDTKPEIDNHRNALAIGSLSSSTLNRIIPSWSQFFPAIPLI